MYVCEPQALVTGNFFLPRYYIYYKVRNRSFVKNLGHCINFPAYKTFSPVDILQGKIQRLYRKFTNFLNSKNSHRFAFKLHFYSKKLKHFYKKKIIGMQYI